MIVQSRYCYVYTKRKLAINRFIFFVVKDKCVYERSQGSYLELDLSLVPVIKKIPCDRHKDEEKVSTSRSSTEKLES